MKKFLKLLNPVAKNLEEIWKIEGYTRDVESSKVTHYRCKLSFKKRVKNLKSSKYVILRPSG